MVMIHKSDFSRSESIFITMEIRWDNPLKVTKQYTTLIFIWLEASNFQRTLPGIDISQVW